MTNVRPSTAILRARRWPALLAGTLVATLASSAASGSQIYLERQRDGQNLIYIKGELGVGDGDAFARATAKLKNGLVLLDSPGGRLATGLQIGALVQNGHFSTAVLGEAVCASACGLIWFAGNRRFLSPSAHLGFHAAYDVVNGEAVESGLGNALVGSYLTLLGADMRTIVFFTMAKPGDVNWLTPAIAADLGIDVQILDDKKPEAIGYLEKPPVIQRPKAGRPQASVRLATDYFHFLMSDRTTAALFLDVTYDNFVFVQEQLIAKPLAVSRRIRQIFTASSRFYQIDPATVRAECAGLTTCSVAGNFYWMTAEFNQPSPTYGKGQFALDLNFEDGTPKIVGEELTF